MAADRVLIPTRVQNQLHGLPPDVRPHVEAFLENLALLLGRADHADYLNTLTRVDDGFVATIIGVRVRFSVETAMRIALLQAVEQLLPEPWTLK